MKGMIQGSDAFVFESNHDVDMLRMCGYPWKTKQRILSDMGHVSNEDAGRAIGETTLSFVHPTLALDFLIPFSTRIYCFLSLPVFAWESSRRSPVS